MSQMGSVHLSGCASESSKLRTPSTAFWRAALRKDAAADGPRATGAVAVLVAVGRSGEVVGSVDGVVLDASDPAEDDIRPENQADMRVGTEGPCC